MVVIDTSVWIEYLRGGDKSLVHRMNGLLDSDEAALAAPVLIEVLSGASKEQARVLKRVLSAIPEYRPSGTVWDVMKGWVASGRERGHKFAAMDLLIAGIAGEQHAAVWSLDRDFERMSSLGYIRRFEPGF